MAREEINIGVEGNDGTGDSIREAFRKVNENFSEIYAIFGLGGAIGFTSLNDTPSSLTRDDPDNPGTNLGNLVPSTNDEGTALLLKELVGDGIGINTDDPDRIVLSNTGGALFNDKFPKIGGPLDLQTEKANPDITGFPIARVRIDEDAVDDFNSAHGLTGFNRITIDDLVIDKKYADKTFLSKSGDDSSGAVGLRDEPIDISGYQYNIINVDVNPDSTNYKRATILDHGFNDGINGRPFVFNGLTGSDLIPGETYYIHRVDEDTITLHLNEVDGQSGLNPLIPALGLIENARYDSSLQGFWLENEALPRKSVVRRQGDDMEGPLFLSEHPGLYNSVTTTEPSDLQAATKYYVDQNAGKVSNFQIYVSAEGNDNPNSPFGLEGRSSRFAFRTIGRACELAEEQVIASPVRPGPYMQTITANDGRENSEVRFKGIADVTEQGLYVNLQTIITSNLEFLKSEAIAFIDENFPSSVYDRNEFKQDIENIINSLILDIRSGTNVNALTRIVSLRFFSTVENRIKIGNQFDQTLAALERIQALIPDICNNNPVVKTSSNPLDQVILADNAEGTSASQISNLFEIIKDIIGGDDEGNPKGLASAPPLIEGSTYKIEISNGGNSNTDQASRENFDIRQGKVIRGKLSGAIGRIVAYERGGNSSTVDEVYLQLQEPIEFELNEELEYGNYIKDVEISIRIDAGTYHEQLPIRVPENTSIKGDEFRRVIVRPAEGVSQSKWVKMYFYRDQQFDELDLLPTGNTNAVKKITDNTRFVVAETIAWIDDQVLQAGPGSIWSGFTYDGTEYQEKIKKIIDAIRWDIVFESNFRTISTAIDYFYVDKQFLINQKEQLLAAFEQAKLYTTNAITDPAISTTAELLWDEIIEILQLGVGRADVLNYPDPVDYNTTYLQGYGDARAQILSNKEFIIEEITAWITDQIINNNPPFTSFFRYDTSKWERDVERIVDNLIYDLTYGGNLQTIESARTYFVNQVPTYELGEKEEILASYAYLKSVVQSVISATPIVVSAANELTQDTSGTPGSADSILFANTRVQEIYDYIDGDGITLPVEVTPDITWTDNNLQVGFNELDPTTRDTIASDTTAWIDNEIANAPPYDQWAGFDYNSIKCARDLNIILTGIINDLKFTGNANSYENARSYFLGAVSRVTGQQTQTAAALNFARDLVKDYVLADILYPNPLQTDQLQVIDTSTTTEDGTQDTVDTLMTLISGVVVGGIEALSNLDDPRYGYHYLTDPKDINSTPKENKDIDVFMMNDAGILRNLSPTGHGGFMCVLDPDGQILTKSPYIQTGSSFSQSINKKAFRGGMFVDAWSGNTPMLITNVVDPFRLEVESIGNTGLFYKKPQMPAPFYIDGVRYQVNAIQDYNQDLGKCTLILDRNSGRELQPGIYSGFSETIPPYFSDDINPINRSGGYQIIVQTAGGRSMLANDFTQINDLGYGVVGRNGALIELVSMFTYYCTTAYYADSGAQIRSLNGSNAYGDYGLVAEGADPNEIPDRVELIDNMIQPALVYDDGGDYKADEEDLFVYVYGTSFTPHARGEIEIDHGVVTRINADTQQPFDDVIGVVRYEIATVQNLTIRDGVSVPHDNGRDTTLYKLGFSTEGGEGRSAEGLRYPVPSGTPVTIRSNQNFKFDDVSNTTPVRPSTAIEFDEIAGQVYRSIAFNGEDATGVKLPDDVSVITVDATYDYLRFSVRQDKIVNAHPNPPAGYGGTLGANIGDQFIAVDKLSRSLDGAPDDVDRAESGRFILGWQGKIHKVISYKEQLDYAIIELEDVLDEQAQLAADVVPVGIVDTLARNDYDLTLRAGLIGKGEIANISVQDASITFQISTCRATGHDFLDIGTGGFNTTNYPNVIFGDPAIIPETPNPREVDERTQGRCFYVSTDQDGFFRVGPFFTVDQGTGTVSFSAAIALSNLDGLGFKRGVVVTAFLTDTGMTDNATDAVPTQSAVVGYVDRRLSFDQNGVAVDDYLSRYVNSDNGQMYSRLNMNDNPITNVPDILSTAVDGTVAVNKNYVDGEVDTYSQIDALKDTEIINPEQGDILLYTGYKRIIVENVVPGDWTTRIGQQITSSSGAEAIIIDAQNTDIRGNDVTIITYELTPTSPGTILPIDDVYIGPQGSPIIQGQIILNGGPLDEIGNAHIGDDGDVSVSVYRPGNDGSSVLDTIVDFTLNDTVIANNHVKHDAGIDQYKLDLNAADTYPKANVGSITQNNLGVAAFNDVEFNSTDGFIEILTNGIQPEKITNVDQYQTIGRLGTNNGDMTVINFSDIVDNGGSFTTTGQGDGLIVKTLTGGGIDAGPRLQINNNTAIALTGASSNIISLYDTANELVQLSTNITVLGNILPDNTVNNREIGSTTQVFDKAYITTLEGTATRAQYADLAENYVADKNYEPGTVLVFGGPNEVIACVTKDDRKVAGIVSTDPAYLMNSGLEGDNVVALALQGRVPCKVIGKVEKGDILVTSAIPGYAIVNNDPKVGTVIGKAVGAKDDTEKGVVEIVVGRV